MNLIKHTKANRSILNYQNIITIMGCVATNEPIQLREKKEEELGERSGGRTFHAQTLRLSKKLSIESLFC